jgi:aspartate/methionine/tyrosine aminotransferase
VVEEMRCAYEARRDFVVDALNNMAGVECPRPEGAFYVFPRFLGSERDSLALCEVMLDQAGIAGTPGVGFGASGEGHVRFSIATSMADLERAMERLARVAPGL